MLTVKNPTFKQDIDLIQGKAESLMTLPLRRIFMKINILQLFAFCPRIARLGASETFPLFAAPLLPAQT